MEYSRQHNWRYQGLPENKLSLMKTLNSKGPKFEPCGSPNNISLHETYLSFILTLCFLYEKF